MSRSQILTTCFHCLRQYISGDGVINMCNDCRLKGHTSGNFGRDCTVCKGEAPEKKPDPRQRPPKGYEIDDLI